MKKQTHKPNEQERREKINAAIDASIEPSPDSAHLIAEKTGEHPTMVHRQFKRRFVYRGGRWVARREDDE